MQTQKFPEPRTGETETAGPLSSAEVLKRLGRRSIVLVGIIYALLLRHVWNPEGAQLLADRLLHQAVPVLFLIVWLVGPHGRLRLADTVWAMAPPLAYLVYALARGEADGWYAYWFLDPAKLGAEKMVQNAVVLALVFCGTALLFIGIDRAIGHRRG